MPDWKWWKFYKSKKSHIFITQTSFAIAQIFINKIVLKYELFLLSFCKICALRGKNIEIFTESWKLLDTFHSIHQRSDSVNLKCFKTENRYFSRQGIGKKKRVGGGGRREISFFCFIGVKSGWSMFSVYFIKSCINHLVDFYIFN